jgi:hypothetical protein
MRTAFFVQIVLVTLIAAVSLTGRSSFAQLLPLGVNQAATQTPAQGASQKTQGGAQAAADECLAKPGGTAPQGSHWYYRINRADGRHCWYLGPEGQKIRARAKTEQPAAAPKPIQPAAERPAESPVAETAISETKPVVVDASAEPAGARLLPEAGPRHPATMTVSNAAEQPAAAPAADEEMPLIWPVLSPAEIAAGKPAPQSVTTSAPPSKLRWEYILAIIAGALALAAMLIGAMFNRAAAREVDRDHADARAQWQAAPSVMARLRIEARPQSEPRPRLELRPQFAETLLAARRSEPVRSASAASRRDDGARWPLRPIELSSDPNRDVESSLQRLLQAWQHSAA